jgi:hypothetical protein
MTRKMVHFTTTLVQARTSGKTFSLKNNDAAISIDRPSFTNAERIWTENDLAIIIGVEKYQDLPAAEYSSKDARLIKAYILTLGIRELNIELLLNKRVTLSGIKKTLEMWLPKRAMGKSIIIIYYSSNGALDASSGDSYLVPYDGDHNYLSDTGYPLKHWYEKLGHLQAREVIVVLDSCFSGVSGRSVLANGARPMVVMTESPVISTNIVVFSAAEGSHINTSSPEKGHGSRYFYLSLLKSFKRRQEKYSGYLSTYPAIG